MDKKNHKLVWINGIHNSIIGKKENKDKLFVVADGRNLYFNFWVDLTSGEIVEKK